MSAERARGFSTWKGERTAQGSRWWVIAKGNMSLAWSNKWVKIIALLSLMPGIVAGGIVYFFLPLSSRILMQVLQGGVIFVFLFGALVGARLISEDRKQGAFVAHFARPVRRVDYLAGKVVSLALPLFAIATASGFLALRSGPQNLKLGRKANGQNSGSDKSSGRLRTRQHPLHFA